MKLQSKYADLVLNLLVPGLYVYGALKTKPNVNA